MSENGKITRSQITAWTKKIPAQGEGNLPQAFFGCSAAFYLNILYFIYIYVFNFFF